MHPTRRLLIAAAGGALAVPGAVLADPFTGPVPEDEPIWRHPRRRGGAGSPAAPAADPRLTERAVGRRMHG